MKIYIGADHAGYRLKKELKKHFNLIDLGNSQLDQNDDYPDFARKVSQKVKKDKNSKGILICGGGQGMSMVANRQKGIRASLGYSIQAAKISRKDNDSNILCLASRELKKKEALKIVNTFLKTPFSKIKKHQRRINKI